VLRPRGGTLPEDAFFTYFSEREGWSFPDEEDHEIAAYVNETTGVYFQLYRDEHAIVFSVELFRCTPFVLEADLELAAMVEHFDLAVEDPQDDGIEGAVYNDEQLFRGFARANADAYANAAGDGALADASPLTYDGDALEDIWRWNYNSALTAEETDCTVPAIGFVLLDGIVHTIAAFEATPALVPQTDLVALTHEDDEPVAVPWPAFAATVSLGAAEGDDPLPYHRVVRATLTNLRVQPSLDVTALALDQVHAFDDVEGDAS
ncbi:MAG TPA: hypothetical protein VK427_21840, partial [Kofleriaceae bacterium]|nr:hypothetical protein [Kofleriaceae bacterium]